VNFRERIPAEACFLAVVMGVFGELLIVPFTNKQLTREATVVTLVKAESDPS